MLQKPNLVDIKEIKFYTLYFCAMKKKENYQKKTKPDPFLVNCVFC